MKQVVRHPVVGEVTLSQTGRARRVSITVKPSGEVRLSFPERVSARKALSFLEERVGWIEAARERIAHRMAGVPVLTPEQQVVRREQLRRVAKEYLPGRVAELAAATGLDCRSVTIRATRSKWGSCSARGDLSLSLYLMALPEHLRDYVIVHELAHTVHHNHSARFHALVDRLLGGREKELRRELRGYRTV